MARQVHPFPSPSWCLPPSQQRGGELVQRLARLCEHLVLSCLMWYAPLQLGHHAHDQLLCDSHLPSFEQVLNRCVTLAGQDSQPPPACSVHAYTVAPTHAFSGTTSPHTTLTRPAKHLHRARPLSPTSLASHASLMSSALAPFGLPWMPPITCHHTCPVAPSLATCAPPLTFGEQRERKQDKRSLRPRPLPAHTVASPPTV